MALGEERMKSKLKVWRLAPLLKCEGTEGIVWGCSLLPGDPSTTDKGSESWRILSAELNQHEPLQCKGTPIRIDEPRLIKSLTGYMKLYFITEENHSYRKVFFLHALMLSKRWKGNLTLHSTRQWVLFLLKEWIKGHCWRYLFLTGKRPSGLQKLSG